MTGPVVAQMQAIFSEDWTFTTGRSWPATSCIRKSSRTGSMQSQAIKASKGDSSSLPKMLYFMAIQAARKSIHIQNAYFLPDSADPGRARRGGQAGVDVNVMVPGAHNDVPLVRMASRHHYGPLLKGGVKIYEYVPTMIAHQGDGRRRNVRDDRLDQLRRTLDVEERRRESFVLRPHVRGPDRGDVSARPEALPGDHVRGLKHRGSTARFAEAFSRIWEPYY